ncbi:MAG TPA: hypothetical protein VND15_03735 [Candidatus Acidoferrales bacterium]|nr:hypothetical protein [Candidatus Acidoferrales bacterium]
MDKNIVLYAGIAIVIVAVALVAALVLSTPSYNVKLALVTNSTQPVYPYQTAHFAIVLQNKGSSISNLVVGFYLNGSELSYYRISLPANKTVAVATNYTFQRNGTYQFSAVADSAHVLPLTNRNTTAASLSINVTQAAQADIFTSIPNSNVTYSQSFSFANVGLESSSAIADRYNISIFNNLFAIPQAIVTKVAENLVQGTAYANGAYVNYTNGTSAYTLWLQGVETPQNVQYIVSTFGLQSKTVGSTNSPIGFTRVSNTTSMCTLYAGGWTKIVSYFNDSMAGNCAAMAATSYQPTEANVLVTALKANSAIPAYRAKFSYKNTSLVGSSISYSNATFGVASMFYNNFGFFTSIIQSNQKANATRNNTTQICRGLAYGNGTTNVCSVYVVPRDGKVANGFALVNSVQIGSKYVLQLFSLINQTNSAAAHVNAVSLIRALNISQNSTKWGSAFTNFCTVRNSSIGCKVTAYDYTNNTAYVNITNNLSGPLTLNRAACYVPGVRANVTVNTTINTGGSANLKLLCANLPIPVVSPATSYLLTLNYTYQNRAVVTTGELNITNSGFR